MRKKLKKETALLKDETVLAKTLYYRRLRNHIFAQTQPGNSKAAGEE